MRSSIIFSFILGICMFGLAGCTSAPIPPQNNTIPSDGQSGDVIKVNDHALTQSIIQADKIINSYK